MKKYGTILDFKDKIITVDEVKLPFQNINYLQGYSTLRVLKLNHSLALELHSTQDTTKHVTRILDANIRKQISTQLSETIASILAPISKRSYCSYSRNMCCSLTAP
jgi:hypothetical protein